MKQEYAPIEEHIRIYRGLLKLGPLKISLLEEGHARMGSSLHPLASSDEVDVSAFLYSARRLPDCIVKVDRVVMGKSDVALRSSGLIDSSCCIQVQARSRRRLTLFDGRSTLAANICSPSDLDDLVPALTCYQMEWNKIHSKLVRSDLGRAIASNPGKVLEKNEEMRKVLHISRDDWEMIQKAWGDACWGEKLSAIANGPKDITVEFASADPSRYRDSMAGRLTEFLSHFRGLDIERRPVYFVSSNDHSLANLLSGFAAKNREEILAHVLEDDRLRKRWELIKDDDQGFGDNLLYYSMQAHLRSEERFRALRTAEEEVGIRRHDRSRFVDLRASIIEIGKLQPDRMDGRLTMRGLSSLKESRALILNVDYPLGLSARYLLSQAISRLEDLKGVYIMGKAATMYGRLGDVMIPAVVFDMHSGRLFTFENCFSLREVRGHLRDSAVFDDQRAVTVRGTFLHNREAMEEFKRDDYNSIEMEAGPYLSAVLESHPSRGEKGEKIELGGERGFDFGILHYASDTPYSQRVSLLSKGLGYEGIEATYACSLAILKRILEKEVLRLKIETGKKRKGPGCD